ncbi:ion channel [Dolichospermum sp. ST_sed1]|nr:ion channel [Dolichospermum sp. ST_sed1]
MKPKNTINIESINVPEYFQRDFYHKLLNVSWRKFFFYYCSFFIGINLIFSLLYFFSSDSLTSAYTPIKWIDCFSFSVQTFSTIGYGAIYPSQTLAHIYVVLESMISLSSTAMLAGLFFARFSRPTSKFLFSSPILITNFNNQRTLMFRVANARTNKVLSANIEVNFTYMAVTAEGIPMRRLEILKLHRSSTPIFSLSWSVMHTIDETSPLFQKTMAELEATKVEFFVLIHGIDDTFGQSINGIHIYKPEDLVFDRQFVDVISVKEDGGRVIDYQHFHSIKPIDS